MHTCRPIFYDYQNPVYVNKALKQYEKIEQILLKKEPKK